MNEFLPSLEQIAASWDVAPVALLAALLAGEASARFLRLPRLIGYTATGLLLGPFVLGWVSPAQLQTASALADLGLGLLVFELGYRLNPRWLAHNPWLMASSLAESGLVLAGIAIFLHLSGMSAVASIAIAALAIATSPAAVMEIVRDSRAAGQATERLILLTALNTIYAAVVLKAIHGWLYFAQDHEPVAIVGGALYTLAGSVVVAAVFSWCLRPLRALFHLTQSHVIAVLFGLLLLLIFSCRALALSPFIAAITLGILVRHYIQPGLAVQRSFGVASIVLVAILFFTGGAASDWRMLALSGGLALMLCLIRTAAKVAGILLFALPSGLSLKKGLGLGFALAPASALTLMLFGDLQAEFPKLATDIGAAVIGMVLILEFVGPLATHFALRFSGEVPRS